MSNIKLIIEQNISDYISEAAKLTNGEANKIGKLAKKEAVKIRKGSGPLSDKDADYMEMFASDVFSRNLKTITRTMNSGETENREQVFSVVSKVIGKERANHLAKGDY